MDEFSQVCGAACITGPQWPSRVFSFSSPSPVILALLFSFYFFYFSLTCSSSSPPCPNRLMVPIGLADRRGIELSELENSSPPPLFRPGGLGDHLPASIRTILVCRLWSIGLSTHVWFETSRRITINLEQINSRVAEAKSQSRFDGVEGAKGGDEQETFEADKCP
ncbi:uncharacterized protein LY79DRAFT_563209 [Colletotrichum navitas]|uniref:Uncharacterized protein n=1 Tax=Colletotrichum navitas TaxID=681940 RepID=A0AAD8V039_9PEZI|nr:uncharacterized protein LY79DRAFT_563209 [Colletotrichum navitas]KAK1579890.1 hypothetical protein LY79DRAFT_563209 [Colletotrichum navitas]